MVVYSRRTLINSTEREARNKNRWSNDDSATSFGVGVSCTSASSADASRRWQLIPRTHARAASHMPSKLISSRDPCLPSRPLTPRRASSVHRNLSSRKVARPSRYSDLGRADQLPSHRLRSRCSRPSKIDHRCIVVRTCRIVSCLALVTFQRQTPSGRSTGQQRFGRRSREGIAPSRDESQTPYVCVRAA